MGFFSIFKKIFKPITKVFRTVGKFIKKGFQKLGKFMNKFGILGQIGMAMVTGMAGSYAMQGLFKMGSGLTSGVFETLKGVASTGTGAMGKAASTIVKGINATMKFGGAIKNTYNATVGSITKAIGNVVKPVMKRIANVIPGINIQSVDPITGKLYTPKVFDGQFYDEVTKGLANTWEFSKASAGAAKVGLQGLTDNVLTPAQLSAKAQLDAVYAGSPAGMKKEALLNSSDKALRDAAQQSAIANAETNLGRPLDVAEKAAIVRGEVRNVAAFQSGEAFDPSILEAPIAQIQPAYSAEGSGAGRSAQTQGSLLQQTTPKGYIEPLPSAIGSEGTGTDMSTSILDNTKLTKQGETTRVSLTDNLNDAIKVTTSQNLLGIMNPREAQTLTGGSIAMSDFMGLTQSIYSTGGVNQDLIQSNVVQTPKGPIDFNNSSFDFYNLDRINNNAPNYALTA